MRRPLRDAIKRLEREAALWREEPMKRLAFRSRFSRPRRVRQFASFGAHSIVSRPAWLYGAHKISIGDGVVILPGWWIAVERQAWDRPEPVVEIGDRVFCRIGGSLAAAESVVIERDVLMGAYVSIVDSNHTWSHPGAHPLFSPIRTAPIRIGRGSWLADRVAVVAGADIGEQCLIGANSVVREEIPDFSIAVGNPARVVGSTR